MKTFAYWGVAFALWSIRAAPEWVARLRARLFVGLMRRCVPKWSRVAMRNLEIAGFEGREAIVDGVFHSLTRLVYAFAKFPTMSAETVRDWIAYDGYKNFTDAESQGRGVLVATAHLGNWELSAFAHAWMHKPMNIVVRPLDNPKIDALVTHHRELSGNHVIGKTKAAREIIAALRRGEAVGILIDQNSSLDEGVFVDFFGHKACTNAAFVKLAHKTGAPVVPGYAVWEESKQSYVLRFDPEIPMTGDVTADTQRVHSHLEQVIREYPDQWLWIHRRWKTRPPGEGPLH